MKVRGSKTQELADAINAVAESGKATPEEVKTLRILSAEIVASNKAKDPKSVSKDVYYGKGNKSGSTPNPGIDFKGVFTYQEDFDKAFAKNDKDTATKEFDGLNNFVKHHGTKLDTYNQLKPGTMALVDKQGNWQIKKISDLSTEDRTVAYARKNGGFVWFGDNPKHTGLENTIANIEEELSVMVPVLQKMSLELGKPINTPAVKPEGKVSGKQTVETKQTKEERQEVSKPAIVDKRTEPVSTGKTQAKPEEVTPVTVSTEQEKLINETQVEILADQTTSIAETTTQSESKEDADDTGGTRPSIDTGSDKPAEQRQVIQEDKKYTSKQEVLNQIKQIRKSIDAFFVCAF
jgi:hypothetical protein